MRVAAPLCCITVVLPVQVAMPFFTCTCRPSLPIFDLASLALMVASISSSLNLPWLWDLVSVPAWAPRDQIRSERIAKTFFMLSEWPDGAIIRT